MHKRLIGAHNWKAAEPEKLPIVRRPMALYIAGHRDKFPFDRRKLVEVLDKEKTPYNPYIDNQDNKRRQPRDVHHALDSLHKWEIRPSNWRHRTVGHNPSYFDVCGELQNRHRQGETCPSPRPIPSNGVTILAIPFSGVCCGSSTLG